MMIINNDTFIYMFIIIKEKTMRNECVKNKKNDFNNNNNSNVCNNNNNNNMMYMIIIDCGDSVISLTTVNTIIINKNREIQTTIDIMHFIRGEEAHCVPLFRNGIYLPSIVPYSRGGLCQSYHCATISDRSHRSTAFK